MFRINVVKLFFAGVVTVSFLPFANACDNDKKEKRAYEQKAYYPGKPGADVAVKGDIEFAAKENQTQTLDIEFTAPAGQGILTIQPNPDQDLLLVGAPEVWQFDLSKESPKIAVDIVATQPGRHYLMFTTTITQDGETQGRATGIAVDVGENTRTAKVVAEKPASEIVSMGAEETVY